MLSTDVDAAEFVEQARWLLEWHTRRGEAIATRATAVLGFVGVVLALLLQGAGAHAFRPAWSTWVAAALAGLGLGLAAVYALMAIAPQAGRMPSVGQLRQWWSDQLGRPAAGRSAAQIAESILHGQNPDEDSPISAVVNGATSPGGSRSPQSRCSLLSHH